MDLPLLDPPERCPACGQDGPFRALHVYPNAKRLVSSHRQVGLVGCERCGLVFTHPQPTDTELERYYGTSEGWEQRIDGDGEEFSETEAKLAIKHERHRHELQLLGPLLDPGTIRRALDFGCGLGAWLDVLKENGWKTHGLEPGPRQRGVAGRNHHMIEEVPAEPLYGLVVLNHVVEHLRDPLSVLHRLAEATVPGGYLFVSVPDLGRLGEHGKWNYVKSEQHICSYTAASLGSLLALAGFRLVDKFDANLWDAVAPEERWRLKALGRRTETGAQPSGRPLEPALEALRAYSAKAEAFETSKRERKDRERAVVDQRGRLR